VTARTAGAALSAGIGGCAVGDLCDTGWARRPGADAAEAPSFSSPTAARGLSASGTHVTPRQRQSGDQTMKGAQKPKKTGKKPAQKTLKERRVEKRAAAKQTRSLDV